MARHQPFRFRSSAELLAKAEELGPELPFQVSLAPLFEPLILGTKKLSNRLAVQPMEGCDGKRDGSPAELTFRRYRRYAEGGSGLIWFEATSVVEEGRSNPHQLLIQAQNLDAFKRLVEQVRSLAHQAFGNSHQVFLVLQLTHSGRYSKPQGIPKPRAACLNPLLDKKKADVYILSDDELCRLEDKYVKAARLAWRAGFDAVDIKACHGYLVNELLSARTRNNSRYGGSFEKRSLFLRQVMRRIKDDIPQIFLAVRLSAYDGLPFPHSFGVSGDNQAGIDLTEPKSLVGLLIELGCSLFNITVGNPHLKPHLGRPFDRPLLDAPLPEEHPLEGVCRLISVTQELQRSYPETPFVGTGYSWLRHFFPYVGAAVVAQKRASLIGLGRSSFAYPDAPRDLLQKNALDPKKVCLTCSRCSQLMRSGQAAGCVIRDSEVYGPEYKKLSSRLKAAGGENEEECGQD